MTTEQAAAKKFYLITEEFGFKMFVAPLNNGEIDMTDNESEAEVFTIDDTLSSAKLPYYKSVTGYKGLHFVAA